MNQGNVSDGAPDSPPPGWFMLIADRDDLKSDDAPQIPTTAGGPADGDDRELLAAILARASKELRFDTADDAFYALTLVMDHGDACLISYRPGENDDPDGTYRLMVIAMPHDAAVRRKESEIMGTEYWVRVYLPQPKGNRRTAADVHPGTYLGQPRDRVSAVAGIAAELCAALPDWAEAIRNGMGRADIHTGHA